MASTDPLYNDLLPIESRASMGARPQAVMAATPASTLGAISGALPAAPTFPAPYPPAFSEEFSRQRLREDEAARLRAAQGQGATESPLIAKEMEILKKLQGTQAPAQPVSLLDRIRDLLGMPRFDMAPGASPANTASGYPMPLQPGLFGSGTSPLDRRSGGLFGVPPSQEPSQEEIERRRNTGLLGARG